MTDSSATLLLTQTFDPYGNKYASAGTGQSSFGYTGEMQDSNGLLFLRARYYNPSQGRFFQRDTWGGNPNQPQTLNPYVYGLGNPLIYTDFSGRFPDSAKKPDCPLPGFDCESVTNIFRLRKAFLESAVRHNKIPGMDDNAFAALIVMVIRGENRIGNVYDPASLRNENLAAGIGCVVSGYYLKRAFDDRDYGQLARYLLNQDIPDVDPIYAYASVGIGNMNLSKAADLWQGQACNTFDECLSVEISPLRARNLLGFTIDVSDPYTEIVCGMGGVCSQYELSTVPAYQNIEAQLRNDKLAIEYTAALLEAGALRAIRLGITPTGFNSATWYIRSVQTDEEINKLPSLGLPDPRGHANFVVHNIPTALDILSTNT